MAGIERGVVNAAGEALLSLTVLGVEGFSVELEALLDTGFNDSLALPPDVIAALGLLYEETVTVQFADGSEAEAPTYRASIDWLGERREVVIIAMDGGALIGIRLLFGTKVTVDVVEGGAVTIEALLASP